MNIEFKTCRGQFLAIPATKDAFRIDTVINQNIKNRYGKIEWTERNNGVEHSMRIDNIESVIIIGLLSRIEEIEAEYIVDCHYNINKNKIVGYENYLKPESRSLKSASKSLKSLMMMSKIYLENPEGKIEPVIPQVYSKNYSKQLLKNKLWNKAQETTSEDWIILKLK